ncbi:MAG: DUF1730 domain-containing protein [Bacteriovoracaceae bacterium]|nr:DUF1730 domain-containing protein [Bacteriovoracaceae bacterium]
MNDLLNGPWKELCSRLGIVDWGYTEEATSESYPQFEKWIREQKNFPLDYLSGERGKKRESLNHIFPSFQSATVFLFSYLPEKLMLNQSENPKRLAGYSVFANGEDYHHVLHERCLELAKFLDPSAEEKKDFLICIDIYPVLERDLAFRAGLGWFGKNSLLISKKQGSFFLIASILWNRRWKGKDFNPKEKEADHCGHCQKCIDACPTNAIELESRQIITSQCIATYTIEMKDDQKIAPPEGLGDGRPEIFGCDICQDVCPWNGKLLRPENFQMSEKNWGEQVSFLLKNPVSKMISDLESMSDQTFKSTFTRTNFYRTTRKGILKNLKRFLKKEL